MIVVLEDKDIMAAITAYMGLKGFKTGEDFDFQVSARGDKWRIAFEAEPKTYKIESIIAYANKER